MPQLKYKHTSGIKLGPVVTVKYAEAFGSTGLRTDHPVEIAPKLHGAFDTAVVSSLVCMSTTATVRSSLKLRTKGASFEFATFC